jgi:hypothetical protein
VVNHTPTKIEAKAQDGSASSVQPHSAVRKPKKSLQKYILAVVAAIVLIAVVAGWWMHREWVSRRIIQGTGDIHSAISVLNQRIATLRLNLATVTAGAKNSRDGVANDLTALKSSRSVTPRLREQLETGFTEWQVQLGTILATTKEIDRDRRKLIVSSPTEGLDTAADATGNRKYGHQRSHRTIDSSIP